MDKPDHDTIVLDRDGLTFRRISPRQLGTNLADFFLLESEVTNEQYERYLKATGRHKGDTDLVAAERAREEAERKSGKYSFNSHSPVYHFDNPDLLWTSNAPPNGRGNHPVGLITIADARTFCEWLTSRYPTVGLFRLPTVDQWLLAAYGSKRNYPWGDEWNFSIPFVSKSEKARHTTTEPVKAHAKDRTPEGIYGLWGNVAEYVTDSKNPNEPRWMGPSFKTYPMKEEGLFPFTPRNDWWGYVHNAARGKRTSVFEFCCSLLRHTTTTVQRTGASRVAQKPIQRPRRLAPVADLCVRPLHTMQRFAPQIAYYLEMFRSGDSDNAFHGFGRDTLPKLMAVFRAEQDIGVREFLVEVIWEYRERSVIPFLGEALSDTEPRIWRQALNGLVTLASPASLDVLRSARTRQFATERETEEFRRSLEEAIEQAETET